MKTITFRPTDENKQIIECRAMGNKSFLMNLAIRIAESHGWKPKDDSTLEKLSRKIGDTPTYPAGKPCPIQEEQDAKQAEIRRSDLKKLALTQAEREAKMQAFQKKAGMGGVKKK